MEGDKGEDGANVMGGDGSEMPGANETGDVAAMTDSTDAKGEAQGNAGTKGAGMDGGPPLKA